MPDDGQTITSEISGAGNMENRGGRKVVLWSRFGWTNIDTLGSPRLPEGRYLRAETEAAGQIWSIIGMCIPYRNYRVSDNWGDKRLGTWVGACRYLDALREDVLPQIQHRERNILLGDFNLQIPPKNYPHPNSQVDMKRRATFADFRIVTSHADSDPVLDKPFIDHIALSYDIILKSKNYFSRRFADGDVLSDHNGVVVDIAHKAD